MDIIKMAIIIGILVAIIAAFGYINKSIDDNFAVPGAPKCESNDECISYTLDCISHISPNYDWAGDIQCINNKCMCIAK